MEKFGKDDENIVKFFIRQHGRYYSKLLKLEFEDLYQECLLAALQGIPKYSGVSARSTFLYACIKWHLSNLFKTMHAKRREGRQCEVSLEAQTYRDSEAEIELAIQPDEAPDVIDTLAVRQALAQCTKLQREAVKLYFYEGLTYREIEAKIGKSRQVINEHVKKACLKMRRMLER